MMMEQSFPAGRASPAALGQADEILHAVLRRTEESYLAAGSELVESVDVLRQLSVLFDRLRETFGKENGKRLGGLIDATRRHAAGIEAGFDRFLGASEAVRLAVRGVRVEVGDLDRVVRTIANVSINARIQGNGLIPPRPQVSAFIERLAQMAAEAETILGDVREAMAAIGAEMAGMDEVAQELRDEFGQKVLPALARFDRQAQAVLDRQEAMAATNAGLAARMEAIRGEVSRLVTGLQSGDATRQRLERVLATLQAADAAPEAAVLLDLALALSEGAVGAAAAEIAGTVVSADAVQKSAEVAVGQARACYTDRVSLQSDEGGGAEGFAAGIALVRDKLGLMRQRAAGLRERLGAILRHETALRQIGHQVRLSGLNAVLICAKLGEEGRALRELAQWLRTLTDESDAIVLRLQGVLDRTAGLSDRLGGESIGGFETALHGFIDESGQLRAVLDAIAADRAEAARVFDSVSHSLPHRLGNATQALTRFQLLLREMAFFDAVVAARRARLGAADAPDAGLAETLAALRARYTMQAERDIHDRIVGVVPEAGAAAETVSPAPSDDLDDILF